VSATYPLDVETNPFPPYPETISLLPSSYHELSWDDGMFEGSTEVESGDSLAVKYRASTMEQQITRFKWYQIGNGGYVRVVVWGDSGNGFPENILYNELINQTDSDFNATPGWNEYDLSGKDWFVSGDFWIGLKFYSTTSQIAIDSDVGSNSSMELSSGSEWATIDDWNLAIRVFLECTSEIFDGCGICDGDNSPNTGTCDCNAMPEGTAVEDNCGTCDSDGSNDCVQDCAGFWGGSAVEDCAAVCNGSAVEDCAAVCNGSALLDICGICGGSGPVGNCDCDNIPTGSCDCAGNSLDECGLCGGDNLTCTDECGIPNGDDSDCTGCMDPDSPGYDEDATIPCNNNCCTTLANNENIIPSKFEIINLYPNPFNPQINIEYNLPTTSNVRVSIYNVKGQKVDKLVDSIQHTGTYSLVWIASDYNSGIYFVQITADTDIINRKIMLLK